MKSEEDDQVDKLGGEQREHGTRGDGGNSPVNVTVNYQAGSKTNSFRRGTQVSEVLAWAITAFTIDNTIATELELVVEGTQDELPGSKPLASLLRGDSALVLDLVRGDIANGSF